MIKMDYEELDCEKLFISLAEKLHISESDLEKKIVEVNEGFGGLLDRKGCLFNIATENGYRFGERSNDWYKSKR